jgi:hypothetical protein
MEPSRHVNFVVSEEAKKKSHIKSYTKMEKVISVEFGPI